MSLKLNKFKPLEYQKPILKALDDGYKRVLAILPRRAGKDITALNYVIRQMWERPGVYYYIFPTYSQAKKVIWDSMTNDGHRILDYFPREIVTQKNSQELKLRMIAKTGEESLFQLVGSDNYDCFDDQTEILTRVGWKLFQDLDAWDVVATLNPESKDFEWQKPTKIIEHDYDGPLYEYDSTLLSFRVTPNHRFWVRDSSKNESFVEASHPYLSYKEIPSKCNWKGTNPGKILGYSSKEFASFLGCYLSQGFVSRKDENRVIKIAIRKKTSKEVIPTVVEELGVEYTIKDRYIVIDDQDLADYLEPMGTNETRFIYREILELPKDHLLLLLNYLVIGNGTKGNGSTYFFSKSKMMVDLLQELAAKLGKGSVITSKRRVYNNTRISLYQIRLLPGDSKPLQAISESAYIGSAPYVGKVFCVSVPNQIIKVRRNGKEYWSGNSLMGTNPRGCVFSEYALQDPTAYQYIRPILTANGGWALFISTPRGKNHLWSLAELARLSPSWFYYKLSLDETRHIPEEEIERERREGLMSEDMIQQEYYCSFEMGVEGSYYAHYIDDLKRRGRIGDVPWETGFNVHTAWDIGVRDSTTIIFFQTIGTTVRIIDCYENTKEGLEHYAAIVAGKPYHYGMHIAPHDIGVKEWGSGMTRIEKARQLGIEFTTADRYDIADGIEACRSLFSKIWIDESKCAPLIKALENYRQEYDQKRKVYKPKPLHDWSSHFADCFRYLAVSLPKTEDGMTPQELDKIYAEAVYGTDSKLPAPFQQPNQWR